MVRTKMYQRRKKNEMNNEEFVTSPYNKLHKIKKSRIQYQILKGNLLKCWCKKVMILVFSPNYGEALKLCNVDF